MPPPPVSNSGAAEAARRAAEAARRAAEAAEAARKAAQAQAEAAAKARAQANEAQQQAQQVQKKAGPNPSQAQEQAIDQAEARAKRLDTTAGRTEATAQHERQRSIDEANKSLEAARTANRTAEAAGKPAPFAAADRVRDAYEAGNLNPQEQARLFGGPGPVSAQDAAIESTRRIQAATDAGPAQGAAELRRQLELTSDPAQRANIARTAAPQVERMSQAVNNYDDRPGETDLNNTLRDLSYATRAAGPEGGAAIAQSFALHQGDRFTDVDDNDQFGGALRQQIEDGAPPDFGTQLANNLEAMDKSSDAKDNIRQAVDEATNGRPGFLEQAADKGGGIIEGTGDAIGTVTDHIPEPIRNATTFTPLGPVLNSADLLRTSGQSIQDLPETVEAVKQVGQYRSAIDGLGDGDSHTLHVGGSVSGAGLTGKAEGNIEISRGKDDSGKDEYTVSVDAQVGGGIGGILTQGTKGELSGSATANVGGKVELKFGSAKEAKEAVDTMMATAATAAAGPAGAAADQLGVIDHIFGASPGDLGKLRDNISAVEVQGNIAAEISAEGGTSLQGLSGSADVQAQHTARVEFENGQPSAVVLKQKISGNAEGAVSTGGGVSGEVNGGVSGSIEVEERFNIPKDFQLSDLATSEGRGRLVKDAEAKVTFEAELQGGRAVGVTSGPVEASLNQGEGVKATASVKGNPQAILESGAGGEILRGNFDGALDKLGRVPSDKGGLVVEASLERFRTTGIEGGLSVGAGGNGGSLEIGAGTKDFADEKLAEYKGDVNQVRRDVDRLVNKVRDNALDPERLRYLRPIIA
ncbi:hypothetical protein [Pyxidicoccus trucidator]|uniref:hypothetical protein n=1 Tax=Pyxidicoccus trucidator TaxID=2709662 RepID=UPI0013D8ED62|nr:hypothetical protein [Pyxidicoccus trucidator]